jgi:hypothetical protein
MISGSSLFKLRHQLCGIFRTLLPQHFQSSDCEEDIAELELILSLIPTALLYSPIDYSFALAFEILASDLIGGDQPEIAVTATRRTDRTTCKQRVDNSQQLSLTMTQSYELNGT